MSISLYAECMSTIEVGRYGLSLQQAKDKFLEVVEKTGNLVKSIKEQEDNITITLKWDHMKNIKLLYAIAIVNELHADAPDIYYLRANVEVPSGEYIKTGVYSD
jgi:hypothetical protein